MPSGRYAVAVSGGADSVALLRLLVNRTDLSLVVVHLNHQTRGKESDGDEAFARELAAGLGVPFESTPLSDLEPRLPGAPNNPSARFRAARLAFFNAVVLRRQLDGVVVAHHFDDQAETVMLRMLRGSSWSGLAGMRFETRLGSLRLFRPLLGVRRAALRDYLVSIGQSLREDSSNESDAYARNRVRRALRDRERLVESLVELGEACRSLSDWAGAAVGQVPGELPCTRLKATRVIAETVARRWLVSSGVPVNQVEPATVDRLIDMATDAATGSSQTLPGGVQVQRRRGVLTVARDA